MNFLRSSFETTYGKENVQLDREESTFDIQSNKSLFAIAPLNSEHWEFIEKNPEQEMILQELIPGEILRQFE